MSELGDAGAPEQPERRQAALALGDRRQPERIAGLELQLALMVSALVRSLPTMSTWSTKTCGPSCTVNTTSARVPSALSPGLLATVALRKPPLA